MNFEFIPPELSHGWAKLCLAGLILMLVVSACGGDDGGGESVPGDPLAAEGKVVFEKNCARCHSLDDGKVIVGPSLNGIASRAPTRIDGLDAAEYIHQTITKPSAYLVDGFNDLMPSNFQQLLSGDEIDSVIAYLLMFE